VGSVHNKSDVAFEAGERIALTIVVISRKIVKATRRCDSQHANQTKYRLHLASSNETVYIMKLFVPIGPVTNSSANADFARDSGTGVQRLAPSHATAPSERRCVGSSRQSSSRAIHKQGTNAAERQPPYPSPPPAAGRRMEMPMPRIVRRTSSGDTAHPSDPPQVSGSRFSG
jgi:hypothetical protein